MTSPAGARDARILAPDDPEWTRALDAVEHDVYHLPAYAELDAAESGGRAVAALYVEPGGGRLLVPLVLRRVPDGVGVDGWDAASPYGYGGPVAVGLDRPGRARALSAVAAALGAEGVVSAYLRLHPLLSGGAEAWDVGVGAVRPQGTTVWVDLTRSPEELRSGLRSGHRYEIGRLEREGYTVRHDDVSTLDEFSRLYAETMERVGASERYFFGDAYFRALRERLSDHTWLTTCRAPDGAVAAASLFFTSRHGVQYHLSGSSREHRKMAPAKGVLWGAVERARAAGYRWLHLGGGLGGEEDSLFRFKAGFSDRHAQYASLRMLTDPEPYGRALSIDVGDALRAPGFPPHRYA